MSASAGTTVRTSVGFEPQEKLNAETQRHSKIREKVFELRRDRVIVRLGIFTVNLYFCSVSVDKTLVC